MAKCELKPWKQYEKQVVYINEDGTERLIVEFRPDQKYYQRLAHVEVLLENKKGERFWGNYDDWDNPAFSETWENEFLNLLGIPETIEVENEPEN